MSVSRWLPRTLRGRFVFLMLGGVLLAQLLSYVVWSSQVRASHLELVDRVSKSLSYNIASTARFFVSLPLEYRHLVLDQLRRMGGTRFFVSINDHQIPVSDIGPSQEKQLVEQNVGRIMRQELNVDQVFVAFSDPRRLRVLNSETLALDLPPRWAQSLFLEPLSPPVMVVQLQLEANTWLYIATLLPVPGFLDKGSWMSADKIAFLVLMLVVVMLLSLVGIRWMTRPLANIARAAEDFGRDIDHPPMVETGPSEVRATARAFNYMQERIRRYLDERDRLFSAISHDLKTPITRLRLRTELLDDDTMRQRFARDLEELDLMVKGALQYVKETDIHENSEWIEVPVLLESLLADYQQQGRQLMLEGAFSPLKAKPLALKRCLTNIIDNALFYGGSATLNMLQDEVVWMLQIRDHGPGIPPEKLEDVFEPYVRLEPSRNRHTGGTGLGLGIARSLAQGHGGDLVLRNHPEGGLEVTVILPRQSDGLSDSD
ncbi:ATP-binding protein [Pokkaliibacter sp. CJK22405]|uniref:ATP-binding protein n=1 Tax=Pokkaliibacter sp. CJK22405 TaxID=3384615 RepID=UPI003984EC23